MITCETAARIWNCYREIKVGNKLLGEIEKELKDNGPEKFETSPDAFGRSHRAFEMGVPSGGDGHRIFHVRPTLALSVVRAHVAEKTAELAEANEQARIELEATKGTQ